MRGVRRILALGLVVALAVLIPAAVQAGPEYGRSAVGVARRTDGAVVVVTAWCIGNRHEDVRVADYREAVVGQEVYRATGPSSDPLTVSVLGAPSAGFEVATNRPLPPGPMVAYNSGSRRDWLIRHSYPSAATVFIAGELPVSDGAVPERVMVGQLKVITVQQLVASKCVNPG